MSFALDGDRQGSTEVSGVHNKQLRRSATLFYLSTLISFKFHIFFLNTRFISQHQPAAHVVNKKSSHHAIKGKKHPQIKNNKLKPHHGVYSKNLVTKNQPKKNNARRNGPRKVLLDELKGQQQLGPFLWILCDFLRPFINSTIHLNFFG